MNNIKNKIPEKLPCMVENKELEFQKHLFNIRTKRLLKEYEMNAPQPIIDKELELIKKAGENIAYLSRTDFKNN